VACTYRMHGMCIRALQLEFDTDLTARMREVPAPEEALRKAYEHVPTRRHAGNTDSI